MLLARLVRRRAAALRAGNMGGIGRAALRLGHSASFGGPAALDIRRGNRVRRRVLCIGKAAQSLGAEEHGVDRHRRGGGALGWCWGRSISRSGRSTGAPIWRLFVCFSRFFDILKPWPGAADRAPRPGGPGIMLDDSRRLGLRSAASGAADRRGDHRCSTLKPWNLAEAVLTACRSRGWRGRDRQILHRRPRRGGADCDRGGIRCCRARLRDLFE